MFVAYSETKKSLIRIEDAFDLNEVFRCPNLRCSARFTIRSATGKKATYFGRLPSTPHIPGCVYESGDSRYVQPTLQERSSLDAIFEGSSDSNMYVSGSCSAVSPFTSNESNVLRINTPNRLFRFCLMNPLDTEYQPGIFVRDIILSDRNLFDNGSFRGFSGRRFLVGRTEDKEVGAGRLCMKVTATSVRGKAVYLHAIVNMKPGLLNDIHSYICETYGTFDAQPIAIWGEWKKDKEYNISCTVQSKRHIVLTPEIFTL